MIDLYLPPKPAIIQPTPIRQANFLPGWFPAPTLANLPPVRKNFEDHFDSESDTNTYSPTMAFGTAEAGRYLLLMVYASNSNLESGFPDVTIGGVTATKVAGSPSSLTTYTAWIAAVPTGTSGTVSIHRAGNGFISCSALLWSLYDLRDLGAITGSSYVSTGDPATTTMVVEAGGAGFGFVKFLADTTMTWTGLDEDFDSNALATPNATLSGASRVLTSSDVAYSVSSDAASNTSHEMLIVSFR